MTKEQAVMLMDRQRAWSQRNFGSLPASHGQVGALEELGELCHAHLKAEQGIRGARSMHHAAKIDAVGDLCIYVLEFVNRAGDEWLRWQVACDLAEGEGTLLRRGNAHEVLSKLAVALGSLPAGMADSFELLRTYCDLEGLGELAEIVERTWGEGRAPRLAGESGKRSNGPVTAPRVILALDPGTSCGWAVWRHGEGVIDVGTWDLSIENSAGAWDGRRYLKLLGFLRSARFRFRPFNAGWVVWEQVARHNGTQAAHVYGGITATAAIFCEENELCYTAIPVGTVKKTATGKGNAKKAEMIEAAAQAWPQFTYAFAGPGGGDAADAAWIAQTAARELMQ